MVGLALVGQASDFGEPFRLFALAVLPVLLFLGIGTQLRLDSANYHDVLSIIGLNRIRAMYVRLAPDLEPVFVMGTNDDYEGIQRTMATVPHRSFGLAVIAASPVQVAVLNGGLFAAIVGVIAMQLGASVPIGLVAGAAGFVAALVVYALSSERSLGKMMREHKPLIPGRARASQRTDVS